MTCTVRSDWALLGPPGFCPRWTVSLRADRWVRSGGCPLGEDLRINPGGAFPQPPAKTEDSSRGAKTAAGQRRDLGRKNPASPVQTDTQPQKRLNRRVKAGEQDA